LVQLSEKIQKNNLWDDDPDRAIRIVEKFFWKTKARLLDQELIRMFNELVTILMNMKILSSIPDNTIFFFPSIVWQYQFCRFEPEYPVSFGSLSCYL